jgi:hypothetical protein
MIRPKFYLDNQRISEPLNYQELALELNFDKDNPSYSAQVNINDWEIGVGEANDDTDGAKLIQDYVDGNFGIFEGMPFRIEMDTDGDGVDEVIFDGYLNLAEAQFMCHKIVASAVETKNIDWLNDVADSFYFEYLYHSLKDGEAGKIYDSDFVYVPAQKYNPFDKMQVSVIMLTIFAIAIQVWSFISQIIAAASEVPPSGGWAFPRVFSIINLIITAIQLVFQIFLFYDSIFQFLFELVQYKAGMYLLHSCQKASEYLGYTFKSSILEGDEYRTSSKLGFNNVVLLSENYAQSSEDQILTKQINSLFGITDVRNGDELRGYYNGTFGDLLRELKKMFNAKILIETVNGEKILRLERRDYSNANNVYQLPDIDRREIPFTYNHEDFSSAFKLQYTIDNQDTPALLSYKNLKPETIAITKVINSKGNPILKNEKSVNIGFSLVTYKQGLTPQEKFIRDFLPVYYTLVAIVIVLIVPLVIVINGLIRGINILLKAIDSLPGVKLKARVPYISVSRIVNPMQPFRDKIDEIKTGVIFLGTQSINTPKLVATLPKFTSQKFVDDGGSQNSKKGYKPSASQNDLLNSEYLYDNFYSIDSFVGDSPNQYKIYTIEKIPFCIDDYNKVKENNLIKDFDGTEAEVISLKWNIYDGTASITFKTKYKYTDNLQIEKVISDGR